MNTKQKLSLLCLFLLGIFSISFGIWQIYNNLYEPFAGKRVPENLFPAIDENQLRMQAIFALKNVDTDADGLSDFEEIYEYHTSAFLADSDSDGITDKDELLQGTDPNCLSGSSCDEFLDQVTPPESEEAEANLPDFVEAQSADFLRQNLLLQGISPELLNQISDQELEQIYDDMIFKTPQLPQATPEFSPANLSLDDLRQLLLENGMPKTELDKLDDKTLQKIYQETLKN